MKLIKHTNYVYEYQNFVSDDVCDHVTSIMQSSNISSEIWNAGRNDIRNNNVINLTTYKTIQGWTDQNTLQNLHSVDSISHEVFSKVYREYLKDCPRLSFTMIRQKILNFGSAYYYRTYDEKDYYDWHIDHDLQEENLLSFLWYLNEDYSGGKLMFLNDKISIQPKKGSLICFPVGHWWVHKSSPIKSGNKKVIWTCFFKDREKKNV
jgi:hypothetical protein